jgi:glutamate N-acetyltransferase/amino-acid N-acetyltransferase
MKHIEGGVCAPRGFRAAGLWSGIKKNGEPDLMMILSGGRCAAAACYTQNKVQGAPLAVTRKNIADGYARGILCNSGNANTCNPDGAAVAERCCDLAARAAGLDAADFVVASTGVIGRPLPAGPFESGIPRLVERLDTNGSAGAARAIMTTDTTIKEFAVEFRLDGTACRIGAIGKGSGMINPHMATMLVFITTDARIEPALLQTLLREEVNVSLNQICVDGDTSTNDMTVLLAGGLAGNGPLTEENCGAFREALHDVCVRMSRSLAADGEGATKLLECTVRGAPSGEIARAAAKSVIASDLFKAAIFGRDANWGRALCAIGYTAGAFDASRVSLTLQSAAGEVLVCRNSAYSPYSEEEATAILSEDEIRVLVDLHDGACAGTAWGCDLTYDYVRINGDYRS